MIWQTIGTVAISALVTTVIGLLVNFFVSNSKKAINKKKELDKQVLRETVKEVVDESLSPIREELAEMNEDTTILKSALQAELRHELLTMYYEYKKKAKVPVNVKDSFENMFKNYEALGANGVIMHLYEEFMAMPIVAADNNKESEVK